MAFILCFILAWKKIVNITGNKRLHMKNLFIIGNGFDLYHNFKTSYKDFYDYLKNNIELFTKTCSVFLDQFNRKDQLWSDFEGEISAFDFEAFIPDYIKQENGFFVFDNFENIGKEVLKWKKELDFAFKNWITEATQNTIKTNKFFRSQDLFLNFNYSTTLTSLYGVNKDRILYIHNNINDANLIFGHDYEYDIDKGKDYYGINATDLENEYYESVRDFKLICYIGTLLKKDVLQNIERHREFKNQIMDINTVIVLGHSFGKPDIPYFQWIKSCIPAQTKWVISYYGNPHEHDLKLKEIGINCFELYTISEIMDKYLTNVQERPFNK